MFTLLAGCEWYMWRMNLDRIDLAQGQLPKLNRDQDLAGPDLNQNGIRDDIDAYIQQTFHQHEQRKAVQQYALHSQAVLLVDKTDMIRVRRLNFEIARAISCIYDVFPVENFVAANVVKSIGAITSNTKQRFREKLEFSKALDGTSMTMPRDDYCNK
ncbi:hypothetical protein [Acinetobacter sp. ASP199]|uniref:hypothetical protein n=1 Tax=unclassified Acinetobacter TaxID=196816 RepID=UPI001F6232E8|nr:hypothetical protein [Acinetobacter sp. ASP199]